MIDAKTGKDPIAWLDAELKSVIGDPRGKPDCYVVCKKNNRGQICDVMAVFKTEKALRKNFPALVEQADGHLTGAVWWFDDEEKF